MKPFSKFLAEAINTNDVNKAAHLIQKYLTKQLKTPFTKMPGVEHYHNSLEKGYGIRYFFQHIHSIRFNWGTAGLGANAVNSVDYWNGTTHDPNFHLEFDHETSLTKILPTIVDFLHHPEMGILDAIPSDNLNESCEYLTEMAMHSIFDAVLGELKPQEQVPITKIEQSLGSRGLKVINQLRADFSGMFEKQGRLIIFKGDVGELRKSRDSVVNSLGGVRVIVTAGGKGDTYSSTSGKDQVDSILATGIEKVAYKQQLVDLTGLIKLVVKGASNALFIAGRGGTGKTFTVEKVLADMGKTDGDGYFKNTGSASPVGIYKMLYKYRTQIIVFDDSDGALADQDGRNIFKAATDTKKVRKLVWNKDSKNMVDPDQMPEADDQGVVPETDMIPKHFEFTGKIIFISNLQIDKLDPDGALRTRALMVAINPTDTELFDQMEAILDTIDLEDGLFLTHDERMEVMTELRGNPKNVSLRKLCRGLNMRAALGTGEDWKRLVKLYA